MPEFARADVSRVLHVEAREVLGTWTARVWMVGPGPDGMDAEPYVVTFEWDTLDFESHAWQAATLLDDLTRRLVLVLREGT